MKKQELRIKMQSYNQTRIGNFYIKASILGEQILILVQHAKTLKIECRVFLNEDDAVDWLEYIAAVY